MTLRRLLPLLSLVVGLTVAAPAHAGVKLLDMGSSFVGPIYVTAPPLDTSRVVVVQKRGDVVLLKDGVKQSTAFLDIQSRVNSAGEEQGLLSLAFAPDYPTSRKLYVFYVVDGTPAVQIDEYTADASLDHVSASTRRSVLTVGHTHQYHNGGQLQFGPDGKLWFTIGDNVDATNARNTGSLLGKLLRIDPGAGTGCGGGCTIPADNPFGSAVWSYGLRNPWRFSFDRGTGDLWLGDVGDACWEEVDHVAGPAPAKGTDFQWDDEEGRHVHDGGNCGAPLAGAAGAGEIAPILDYGHTGARQAVTGGYVVRDPNLPSLAGRYVYGDFSSGEVWSVPSTGAPGTPRDEPNVKFLASFGEDACARLYAASLYDNKVFRFAEDTPGGGACAGAIPPAGGGGGGGGGGAGGGGGGGGGPVADSTGPVLKLHLARRVRLGGVLRVSAQCDEVCAVTASGRFTIRRPKHKAKAKGKAKDTAAARRPAAPLRMRTARATLAENARVALKLKVTRATRARLHKALRRHRRVTVGLTVVATDTAGNRRTAHATARVVRR